MPFISQIEAVFVTGSLKWNRAIDEKYRVINIISSIEFRKKTALGSRYFLSVQALYVVIRSSQDRRRRTANTVHRQAESRSRQPQRDSGPDQFLAVDRPVNPVMNGESNPINTGYLKKRNSI